MNILEYENTQEIIHHGNLDFPFNLYPCSIPLDFTAVPAHWHNDMEIIYIKKGRGVITRDLISYPVTAGDIVLISPGQLHSIIQDGTSFMEYENIIFHLTMLMAQKGDLCTEQFLKPLQDRQFLLPPVISQPAPGYEDFSCCLREIEVLSGSRSPFRALSLKGLLFQFLFLIFSHYPNPYRPGGDNKSLDQVRLILKYVEMNYPQKISIETMADLSGFSCSHFMKFFKHHLGVSFIEYLNDYRLTMAARMLSLSLAPIASVAGECGFENLSYFNRLFKKKYGTTPSRFRQK